jgi:hypothetical protein
MKNGKTQSFLTNSLPKRNCVLRGFVVKLNCKKYVNSFVSFETKTPFSGGHVGRKAMFSVD